MLARYFIEHPRTVGESYGEHAGTACSFGLRMLAGGLACLAHALIPGLFTTTGSRIIARLHEDMVLHRRRNG